MAILMRTENIQGNVTASEYKDWIALESFNFGAHREIQTQIGNSHDRVRSPAFGTEMSIVKKIDRSTPQLFTQATVGKALPEVKIDVCHTGEKLSPYMQYSLGNVLISNYHVFTRHDKNYDCPLEYISLNFTKLETRYLFYDDNQRTIKPIAAQHNLQSMQETPTHPPLAPPNVNINDNIELVLRGNIEPTSPIRYDLPSGFYLGLSFARLLWFYKQVNHRGAWDYKRQGIQYEAFGNFNYGATARALGLPREFILCMGGWAAYSKKSKPELGDPGLFCLLNTVPPYGDDPVNDVPNIKAGMDYFDKIYGKRSASYSR